MCDNSSLKCFDSKLWPFWLLTCSSVVRLSAPMETAISARQEWPLSRAWPTQRRAMLLQMEPEDWHIEPTAVEEASDYEVGKDNKKKKRKRKKKGGKMKKKRRHKHEKPHVSLGQPANLLLANLATLPAPHPHVYPTHPPQIIHKTTMKPIKYLLRKGSILKKKKQEYLSHLGYVFLPFVKFVTFFTVLNPFTLAVFFFMLISPMVFALLGFAAISLILKPAMSLLFAVKKHVGSAVRRRRPPRKHYGSQRPITIHKHYYQHPKPGPHLQRVDSGLKPTTSRPNFNPLLPQVRQELQHRLRLPQYY